MPCLEYITKKGKLLPKYKGSLDDRNSFVSIIPYLMKNIRELNTKETFSHYNILQLDCTNTLKQNLPTSL